jgi:predicted acyltransferase
MGGAEMTALATITKLPRQRTLTREGVSYYLNNEAIHAAIASRVSETSNFTDSLNQQGFIQQHLLSMKSAGNPHGMLAVFASQRKIVSSALAGNVPPRKKTPSVYRVTP